MTIGERIREIRRDQNISQTQLAQAAGLNQPQVSAIEGGRVKPSAKTIPRFKYKRIEQECKNFKDRSQFVELPHALNISNMVHFILRDLDEVDLKEYKFTVGKSAVSDTVQFITEIGTYGFWVGESPREFAPDYDEFYNWHELGKTVFLTREEAEQALKERENNAK